MCYGRNGTLAMEAAVPVTIKDIDGGVTVATLLGRIDIAGAQDIDMPMNVLAGSKRKVVMDLSQVEFLASMGIRSIVLAAKSIMSKRGTCSLVAPAGNVRTVIESAGIDTIIPTFDTLDDAVRAASPG
jgi:anti-anti-sigma factor